MNAKKPGIRARASARELMATRTYRVGSRKIEAVLYKPIEEAKDIWRVDFAIRGLADNFEGHISGADGMQAITLGMQALRLKLENLEIPFRWYGGEIGASGIPRTIPIAFGLTFSKLAERLVQDAVTEYVDKSIKEGTSPGSRRDAKRGSRTKRKTE